MKIKHISCFLLLVSHGLVAEVAIIVHPSNTNVLDAVTVSKIFLGRDKSFPDKSPVVPVSLGESSATAAYFNEKVLNKNPSQLKAYWSKLIFTGKGTPPKEVPDDAEVIKLVASNPSLIGYVDAASVNDSIKIALKL